MLEVKEDSWIKVSFNESIENKLVFLEINGLESNSCDIEDIGMEVNGISNTLSCSSWIYSNKNNTFHYLLNEDKLDSLSVNIKPGSYKITDISLYTIDKSVLQHSFDEMENIEIVNNQLTGTIKMSSDGYMVFSIPYDEGFDIKVDGNTISYEKVNNSFIGFSLKEGEHKIEITYNSPGFNLGCVCSLFGILLHIGYTLWLLKQQNKKCVLKRIDKNE